MTVAQLLARLPRGDLWVFGYGSLMWSPGFRYREQAPGIGCGYHRSLCIYSHRHRGTPALPGLVMGLRRCGSCWGMAFRIPAQAVPAVLTKLWRREMRGGVYRPRMVRVRLDRRRAVQAVTFVAAPGHRQYACDLDLAQTASLVAQGSGQRGHNLEYLHRTLAHMHGLGVRDPHLERVLTAARAVHGGARSELRAASAPAMRRSASARRERWVPKLRRTKPFDPNCAPGDKATPCSRKSACGSGAPSALASIHAR